jgi:hypothetical protein
MSLAIGDLDQGLFLDDTQDVLLGQDQVLDIVDLELGAAILSEQHLVASSNIHRNELTSIVAASLAYCQNGALLGALFAGGIRQEDATLGLLFAISGLYNNPVIADRPPYLQTINTGSS